MKKSQYEAPVIRSHGKVEDITKGGADGTTTDAFFPVNTPFVNVTFS